MIAVLFAGPSAAAQSPTPTSLAERVVEEFESGTTTGFTRVFPFEGGRELVGWATEHGAQRVAGPVHVVRREGKRALIVLGGHVEFGNTGSETIAARDFSGWFEARLENGRWSLTRALPIDRANRIRSQALTVNVTPGRGLDVVDTLAVEVGDSGGFAARLNHAARIAGVRLDGAPATHVFTGGFLWVDASLGEHSLVLDYTVDVARDSAADANSGRFEREYGHVRNQYYWHPFYDFLSQADLAAFRVTARIPERYRLATDLPQSDTVVDGIRVVRGTSARPTEAVTLFYDSAWRPVDTEVADARMITFVSPDFDPRPDSLARAFEAAHDILSESFGEPSAGYLGIVQSRARQGSGWLFRSNDVIAAPVRGGALTRPPPAPRALFGHEVAHGWTHPTGPASNFLREGWATFAESYLLQAELGPDVVEAFWEAERNAYETGGYEGRATILDDPNNSGVAYSKGSWVLRMLRERMGEGPFLRGLRAYMAVPVGEAAGIEELESALSRAAGRDIGPYLRPWLEEANIPDVSARVEGTSVVLTQSGPLYQLRLELELLTPTGSMRRWVEIEERVTHLHIGDFDVRDVLVDPDHRLLLKRHRGENARFEIEARGAKTVMLAGNLASEEIHAVLEGGVWSVTIPLTEGTYAWRWRIDGEAGPLQSRVVHPVDPLDAPYPR